MTSSPVDILYAAADARINDLGRACAFLPIGNSASPLLSHVVESDRKLPSQSFKMMFNEGVAQERQIRAQRVAFDRPFDFFWGSPSEAAHSQLLRFFLNPSPDDPANDHYFGTVLLKMFFDVVGLKQLVVDHHTQIKCESGTTSEKGNGRIDLLITRESSDCRYAIIIENKVKGAGDTDCQLEKYVDAIARKGFRKDAIYVFYLPLRPAEPSAQSLGKIKDEAKFKVITFETHIRNWIERSGREIASLTEPMRDHLKHYWNLIEYLLKEEKGQSMDAEIMKQLRAADQQGNLPDEKSILALEEYAKRLTTAHRRLTREKFLQAIAHCLKTKNAALDVQVLALLRGNADETIESFDLIRNYASIDWLSVGIPVGNLALVSLTVMPGEPIACGYRRIGEVKHTEFEEFVREHHKRVFDGDRNDWWYSFNMQRSQWGTCLRDVPHLADELLKKYEAIVPAVDDFVASSAKTKEKYPS